MFTETISFILEFIKDAGSYNGDVPQCEKLFHTTYFAGNILFLLVARTKTGWYSNTVIRCYRNLFSLSFVIDLCNFVRCDTGLLVILEYFLEVLLIEYYSLHSELSYV